LDLEQLKHRNSAATEELERPYPPENYVIPKKQWASIVNLLTNDLTLLPWIWERVDALATAETLRLYYQAMKQSLEEIAREQRNHWQEISSQVGKMNEQNSRWVRDLEASLKSQAEQLQENLWKKLTWILVGQSLYLSALLITLMLILR